MRKFFFIFRLFNFKRMSFFRIFRMFFSEIQLVGNDAWRYNKCRNYSENRLLLSLFICKIYYPYQILSDVLPYLFRYVSFEKTQKIAGNYTFHTIYFSLFMKVNFENFIFKERIMFLIFFTNDPLKNQKKN